MEHVENKWTERKNVTLAVGVCAVTAENTKKKTHTIIEHGPHVNNCINTIMLFYLIHMQKFCMLQRRQATVNCVKFVKFIIFFVPHKEEWNNGRRERRKKSRAFARREESCYNMIINACCICVVLRTSLTFKWKVITRKQK